MHLSNASFQISKHHSTLGKRLDQGSYRPMTVSTVTRTPKLQGERSNPVVLNLWSAAHWWSAAICLVVRKQGLTFM